jgi:hydrogenase expression/formation protein HypC
MCLGVPGRVVAVDGLLATVDFWGLRKQIRLEVVDEPVEPGDYILNHVGYAIRRIPPEDIEATLSLYEELLRHAEQEDDLMAADIRGEMAAAPSEEPRMVTAGDAATLTTDAMPRKDDKP